MSTSNPTFKQKVSHEFKEFLVIALYLWLIFGLLIMYKSMILTEQQIDFEHQGLALVNALALAKVMLVARYFRVGDQWKNRPLIFPTVIKSAFYTLVLALFKVLEEGFVSLYHHNPFLQGIMTFLGPAALRGLLTLSALLFVTLIPFVGFGELEKVLGEGKLAGLFLHGGSSEVRASQS